MWLHEELTSKVQGEHPKKRWNQDADRSLKVFIYIHLRFLLFWVCVRQERIAGDMGESCTESSCASLLSLLKRERFNIFVIALRSIEPTVEPTV